MMRFHIAYVATVNVIRWIYRTVSSRH